MGKQLKNEPATTATQALDNIEALLAERGAGWDRIAVRDIIAICYGNTEEFVKRHKILLEASATLERLK